MKTITLQGTEEQFKNLTELQQSTDNSLPKLAETRVYIVDIDNYEFDENPKNWDDEKFISESEIQGRVYTLEGFQKAFNFEEINSSIDVIRFISVPLF